MYRHASRLLRTTSFLGEHRSTVIYNIHERCYLPKKDAALFAHAMCVYVRLIVYVIRSAMAVVSAIRTRTHDDDDD